MPWEHAVPPLRRVRSSHLSLASKASPQPPSLNLRSSGTMTPQYADVPHRLEALVARACSKQHNGASLDPRLLSDIKAVCRQSDERVQMAWEALWGQLRAPHAQVRRRRRPPSRSAAAERPGLALRLTAPAASSHPQSSRAFRRALLGRLSQVSSTSRARVQPPGAVLSCKRIAQPLLDRCLICCSHLCQPQFLEAVVDFRADRPLPPPAHTAASLREKALELLELWDRDWGAKYTQVGGVGCCPAAVHN